MKYFLLLILCFSSICSHAQDYFNKGDRVLDIHYGLGQYSLYGTLENGFSITPNSQYLSLRSQKYLNTHRGYSLGISINRFVDDFGSGLGWRGLYGYTGGDFTEGSDLNINQINATSYRVPIDLFRDFHISSKTYFTLQTGLFLGIQTRKEIASYIYDYASFDSFYYKSSNVPLNFRPRIDLGANLMVEFHRRLNDHLWLGFSGIAELSFMFSKMGNLTNKSWKDLRSLESSDPRIIYYLKETHVYQPYSQHMLSLALTIKYKI